MAISSSAQFRELSLEENGLSLLVLFCLLFELLQLPLDAFDESISFPLSENVLLQTIVEILKLSLLLQSGLALDARTPRSSR